MPSFAGVVPPERCKHTQAFDGSFMLSSVLGTFSVLLSCHMTNAWCVRTRGMHTFLDFSYRPGGPNTSKLFVRKRPGTTVSAPRHLFIHVKPSAPRVVQLHSYGI